MSESTPKTYNIKTSEEFNSKLQELKSTLREWIGIRSQKLGEGMNTGSIVAKLGEFLEGDSHERELYETILKINAASQAVKGLEVGFASARQAQVGLNAIKSLSSNRDDATVEQKAIAAFLEGNDEFLRIAEQVAKDAAKTGAEMAAEGTNKPGSSIGGSGIA